MVTPSFTLFDTAIGRCAIVWRESRIVGLQLPEPSDDATRRRLARRFPDVTESAAPPAVRAIVDRIVALLRGEPCDLSDVELEMDAIPTFDASVYEIARSIGPGTTLTYGEIASRLGERSLARDVGQALARNPFPIVVPCHRVLAAGGKTGGFSARGGVETKIRMLAIENANSALSAEPPIAAPPRARRR
jgi:methylated-DNA-[protein]-cysteine S-methyltransferase